MASIPFDEIPSVEESKSSSVESQVFSVYDEIPTLEEISSLSSEDFISQASSEEIADIEVSGSLSPNEMIERFDNLQTSETFDEGKDSDSAEKPMKLDEDVDSKDNKDEKLDSLDVADDDKKSEGNEQQDYVDNKSEENVKEYSIKAEEDEEHESVSMETQDFLTEDSPRKIRNRDCCEDTQYETSEETNPIEEVQSNGDNEHTETPQMYELEQGEAEQTFDQKPKFEINDVTEEDGRLPEAKTSTTNEESPNSETEVEHSDGNPEMSSVPVSECSSVLCCCEDSSHGLNGLTEPEFCCDETVSESLGTTESDKVNLSREAPALDQCILNEAEMQNAEAVAEKGIGSELVTDQEGNVAEESHDEDGKQVEDIDSNADRIKQCLSLELCIDSVSAIHLGMDQDNKEENSSVCACDETEDTNQVIHEIHFVYPTVAESPQEPQKEDMETIENCSILLSESAPVTEVGTHTIAGIVMEQSIERDGSSFVMNFNQYVSHQGTETATKLASHIDDETERVLKESESGATDMDETSESVVGGSHRVLETLCDNKKQQSNEASTDEKSPERYVVALNQTQIKSTVLKDSQKPCSDSNPVWHTSDNAEKTIVMNNLRATIFRSQIPMKVLGGWPFHGSQASHHGYTKTSTENGQAYGDGGILIDNHEARASFWDCCCFLRWLRPHQD